MLLVLAKLIQRRVFASVKKGGVVLDLGCGHSRSSHFDIFSFCREIQAKEYVGVDSMIQSDLRVADPWSSYNDFEEDTATAIH